ncbi:MAG: ATP-binding protein [Candidatus Hydrogenedentes bacterium]|jgi:signal transduction histidine kinase|nr:ATP-binding protein [Candidatus Hydrogenedentota bacterium]
MEKYSCFRLRRVRVSTVVKEALELLRGVLPSTVETRTDIATDSDDVLADPTQIHQVTMNLCTNAWQAMRDRGGILEARLEPMELSAESAALHSNPKPGPHSKLTVRDTGHRMPESDIERIFGPFYTMKGRGWA